MSTVLRWPIKSSFRNYVERIPDGAVAAHNGAAVLDETFRFEVANDIVSADESGPDAVIASGEVRFGGYGGILVVPFRDPAIRRSDSGHFELSIEYPWSASQPQPRLVIATVVWGRAQSPVGKNTRWDSSDVSLTDEGAELFNNTYASGDQLDRLSVVVE